MTDSIIGYLYWNDGTWSTSSSCYSRSESTTSNEGYRMYSLEEPREEVKEVRVVGVHREVRRVLGSPCNGFTDKVKMKIRNRI